MRRFAVILLLAFMLPVSTQAQDNNQPPAGFTSLFNGNDFTGWTGLGTFDPAKLDAMGEDERAKFFAEKDKDIAKHWSVVDGNVIHNDGQGAYLTTEKEYGDIELYVDYKMEPMGDSGIYLRTTPQIQIWDYTEKGGKWNIGADLGSGGLWNNSNGAAGKDPSVFADKPFGEWNRFRIRQVGARTSVWLNGKKVVDDAVMENYFARTKPLRRKGRIQLQTHGGAIQWRNIFVREIGVEEANEILNSREDDDFQVVFNGRNFDGWSGPTDNYEINDGVLRCKEGKGGTIHTEKEYADFVARLEFKLPAGGNNGLAIRYPGTGDTAYGGMCELQVLDTEHPKYKSIDPRQAHGSAYGMVAATRGYLRDTGEWNFQEVTVHGSKIIVELNGSQILNCDLADVKEYMGGHPHPGKDRKSGYFGFAGHSDAVEYRNVRIHELSSGETAKVAKVESSELGSTHNVHRVGPIYLAGQPNASDMAALKEAGISNVLDLRDAGEVDWDEAAKVREAGMTHQRLAITGVDGMTDEVFDKARETFRNATDGQKVICHCGGANRVGAVWLTYRVLDEGVVWDKALKEAREVGLMTEGFVTAAKRYVETQSK